MDLDKANSFLYPEIEPYRTGFLEVSKIHKLYFEESGNPKGTAVVYLHGGPGVGTSPRDRRHFDPKIYRIVLFDQRGAGKSTPGFCLQENTTWDLVEDIERLRKHLGIDQWLVSGGSWGSTLALIYAETHISSVLGLILRGIFTFRTQELKWFYTEGASNIYPEAWDEFIAVIPEGEQDDLIGAYYKRLTGADEAERLRCAVAWATWELSTIQLCQNQDLLAKAKSDSYWTLQFARIEAHYFENRGFFKSPSQIFDQVGIIRDADIPVTIVQGRYDIPCPVRTAYDLHNCLPKSELIVVQTSGHSGYEAGITEELVRASDKMKNKLL